MHLRRFLPSLAIALCAFLPDAARAAGPSWARWDAGLQAAAAGKRYVLVDVYTDWCGWCKVMDKNTFSEPNVAKILNENFYPLHFDPCPI